MFLPLADFIARLRRALSVWRFPGGPPLHWLFLPHVVVGIALYDAPVAPLTVRSSVSRGGGGGGGA